MFNSATLETIVGLLFVFLLLSLICSTLNELALNFLSLRANNLDAGLRELFDAGQGTNSALGVLWKSSRNLKASLCNRMRADSTGQPVQSEPPGLLDNFYTHPLIFSLYQGSYDDAKALTNNLPSYIPSNSFVMAFMDNVLKGTGDGQAPPMTFPNFKAAVDKITDNDTVKGALQVLMEDAAGDMDKLKVNIAGWYDSTMDRASGWYKRQAQYTALVMSLLIVVLTNADTLGICRSLSMDQSLRPALNTQIQDLVKPAPGATPEAQLAKFLDSGIMAKLPLGWNSDDPRLVPDAPRDWATKAVGWLITILAVSLGAPFWFQVLQQVIRLSKKPDGQSPTAGS
ncbi:hypothetical protein [Fundidesulfovibrio terrae]|uniref:hypothetical protein n=1 Tax=Fundidesulfovibrio terrae TaxID=2922866 RepID=UPI001FAE9077|nr:hypothetical protein [Fundidesulfovibrio terrae]